jgi:hypothetical protein
MLAISFACLISGIALSFCLRIHEENVELKKTIKLQNEWLENLSEQLEKR